jgi:flagellar biosynthesis/type III secretory pathway protein FliH
MRIHHYQITQAPPDQQALVLAEQAPVNQSQSYQDLKHQLLADARQAKAELLAQAQQAAAAIVAQAQQAAALIVDQAQAQHADIQQQGYELGHAQGHADGLAQCLGQAHCLVDALQHHQAHTFDALKTQLAQVTHAVCEVVCQHTLTQQPHWWLDMAEAAISQCTQQHAVTLVMPDALAKELAPLNTHAGMHLMPDAYLQPGQAFVLAGTQAFALGLTEQITQLLTQFEQALTLAVQASDASAV